MAERALKKAISLNESNTFAYNNLAIIKNKQLKFDEAWDLIEFATTKNPMPPQFWENKAEILTQLILSGETSRGTFSDVGYFLVRANYFPTGIYEAFSSIQKYLTREQVQEIISGMINMDIFYSETVKDCVVKPEAYFNIYQKSIEIVAMLNVTEIEEIEFAHYTTTDTANKLIFENSNFRLHTVTTANDPEEGYPLLDFIGFPHSYLPNFYQAFVGSFTFNPDSLNQFRLYGKNDNIEGTGTSLVLSYRYFATESKINNNLTNPQSVISHKAKQSLFRCIYIDPVSKRIVSLGHREAGVFYRDYPYDDSEKEKKMNLYLDRINNLKNDVEGALSDLTSQIQILFEEIRSQQNLELEALKIIPLLLIHLRYLVKHSAFKEEQECRIIQVEPLQNNSRIKMTPDNCRMYIDYIPFHNGNKSYLRSIYWGPKTLNFELFRDRITQLGMDIECYKNYHPFD
ncbi:DUF2971 domain-containing protein [Sphingobacterium corticis]|uniref:DUF2971 domain-containing protein n=1 Tax=Sphingobacterium corticis TaxID=1812823 RepID=A0ABW5NJU5_9SPHI